MGSPDTVAVTSHPVYQALAASLAGTRAELDLYRQQVRDLREELLKAPVAAPVRPKFLAPSVFWAISSDNLFLLLFYLSFTGSLLHLFPKRPRTLARSRSLRLCTFTQSRIPCSWPLCDVRLSLFIYQCVIAGVACVYTLA